MIGMTPATPPSTAPSTIEDGRVEHAAPPPDTAEELGRRQPRGRFRFGIRARMLVGYVGLLAVLVVASVVVARQVLIVRLEEHLDHQLAQEVNEVKVLAGGRDPRTGRPFDGIRRVFAVFLRRNIPARNEVIITYVNGEAFRRVPTRLRAAPYRLHADPELVPRWANLRQRDRREIETPGGRVMYWAEPLRLGGQRAEAVDQLGGGWARLIHHIVRAAPAMTASRPLRLAPTIDRIIAGDLSASDCSRRLESGPWKMVRGPR